MDHGRSPRCGDKRRANEAWLYTMVSLHHTDKEATWFNGGPVDKALLPPLVKQSWLHQVKLFDKERIMLLWSPRWQTNLAKLKSPMKMHPLFIWSGIAQRQLGASSMLVSKPCDYTNVEKRNKIHIYADHWNGRRQPYKRPGGQQIAQDQCFWGAGVLSASVTETKRNCFLKNWHQLSCPSKLQENGYVCFHEENQFQNIFIRICISKIFFL